MAGLSTRPFGPGPAGENDIYTALLVIAAVFVVTAVVCLAVQFHSFYGLENLFRGTISLGK